LHFEKFENGSLPIADDAALEQQLSTRAKNSANDARMAFSKATRAVSNLQQLRETKCDSTLG